MQQDSQTKTITIQPELVQPDLRFFSDNPAHPPEERIPRCLWNGPRTVHWQRKDSSGLAFLFECVD